MDTDGLAKLMEQTREEMIRQFNEMKEHCCRVTTSCNKRLAIMENKIDKQGTSLTRIKSVWVAVTAMWTAIVSLATKYFISN